MYKEFHTLIGPMIHMVEQKKCYGDIFNKVWAGYLLFLLECIYKKNDNSETLNEFNIRLRTETFKRRKKCLFFIIDLINIFFYQF